MEPPRFSLPFTFPADAELRGRRVVVMGLGLFGGGAAVVRFLLGRGCSVLATDLRRETELAGTLAGLADLEFELVLGRHREQDFRDADLIVVNPGVPPDSRFLRVARESGVPLTSEVGLCLSRLRAGLALVTGSKGKSTTASLMHAMLRAAGQKAVLGGNIGISLLDRVDRLTDQDLAVFEVSSFQLEQLAGLDRAPRVVVVTNLFSVHLDRHGSFEEYCRVKREALEGARALVLNHGDPHVRRLGEHHSGAVAWFSGADRPPGGLYLEDRTIVRVGAGPVLEGGQLRLPGRHNLENVMAALLAVERILGDGEPGLQQSGEKAGDAQTESSRSRSRSTGCGVSVDTASSVQRRDRPRGPGWALHGFSTGCQASLDAAREFAGVPHRLERIGERNGVGLVNDSIATAPQSTRAALLALEGPVVLIAGGQDAGCGLDDLARVIRERVRLLVTVGQSGPRLARAVRAAAPDLPCHAAESFEQAVATALEHARPGELVLLSPAFPSFDMFQNFQQRGERFRELTLG